MLAIFHIFGEHKIRLLSSTIIFHLQFLHYYYTTEPGLARKARSSSAKLCWLVELLLARILESFFLPASQQFFSSSRLE